MTTTLVRDSVVGDNWIRQTAAAVPMQRVMNDQGQPTGDIITGPLRLSFEHLFELPPVTAQNQNPKFGAVLLFTPLADFALLYEEYYKVCASAFASHWDAASQSYSGLRSPFRDQAEKLKFGGYTPNCLFITANTKFKPPVVDIRHNPIVDRSKVYAGVWAICSINAYPNLDNRTKGPRFGLQTVMIIGDDKPLGGGGADPNATFKGINVNAPIVRPDVINGMPQGQNAPNGTLFGQSIPPIPGRPGGSVPQHTYAAPPPPPVHTGDDDDNSWNR